MLNHKRIAVAIILTAYISALTFFPNHAVAQPPPFSGIHINQPGIVNIHSTIIIDEQGQAHTHIGVVGDETHVGNTLEGQQESHPGLGCSLRYSLGSLSSSYKK